MSHRGHKPRVFKYTEDYGGTYHSWLMYCYDHEVTQIRTSQIDAFEAALGHFMMFHEPLLEASPARFWEHLDSH